MYGSELWSLDFDWHQTVSPGHSLRNESDTASIASRVAHGSSWQPSNDAFAK